MDKVNSTIELNIDFDLIEPIPSEHMEALKNIFSTYLASNSALELDAMLDNFQALAKRIVPLRDLFDKVQSHGNIEGYRTRAIIECIALTLLSITCTAVFGYVFFFSLPLGFSVYTTLLNILQAFLLTCLWMATCNFWIEVANIFNLTQGELQQRVDACRTISISAECLEQLKAFNQFLKTQSDEDLEVCLAKKAYSDMTTLYLHQDSESFVESDTE